MVALTPIYHPPSFNRYAELFLLHLATSDPPIHRLFSSKPALPRQLEIHLPNTTGNPCNLRCKHCEGQILRKEMDPTFVDRLPELITNLHGKIPFFVFSGAYTEPTLNPKLIDLIESAKGTGSKIGLHTNGTLLNSLESEIRFLSRLTAAATEEDYLTISLDAGEEDSFARAKRTSAANFHEISKALQTLRPLRRNKPLCLGLTYLVNKRNNSQEELAAAVGLAREYEVDYLRFSIPYSPYSTPARRRARYAENFENPVFEVSSPRIFPLLSQVPTERPYVFMLPLEAQRLQPFPKKTPTEVFLQYCFYGYYVLTLGADGYFYRCPSTVYANSGRHRIGRMTTDIEELNTILLKNQNSDFSPQEQCFPHGDFCNRAGLEINEFLGLGFSLVVDPLVRIFEV